MVGCCDSLAVQGLNLSRFIRQKAYKKFSFLYLMNMVCYHVASYFICTSSSQSHHAVLLATTPGWQRTWGHRDENINVIPCLLLIKSLAAMWDVNWQQV